MRRHDGSRRWRDGVVVGALLAIMSTCVVCIGVVGSAAASVPPIGEITNFAPNLNAPRSITAGPDGNMWSVNDEAIVRMAPGGTVAVFPDPLLRDPHLLDRAGITAGPDGNVWYMRADHSIARITPTGTISAFTDPSILGPGAITSGPDGNLWFTNPYNDSIGRISPAGVVSNFTDPSIRWPSGIVAGPDGNLWFTNYNGRSIGRITPSGVVSSFTVGSPRYPLAMVSGPDGNVWFSTAANEIGKITPTDVTSPEGVLTPAGTITLFQVANSAGAALAVGPDGNIWYTGVDASLIGRMTTSGVITTFTDPLAYRPQGIAAGPDGAIWFTNEGRDFISRVTPDGTFSKRIGTGISRPGGMAVGADGRLWIASRNGAIGRISTSGTYSSFSVPGLGDSYHMVAGPDGNVWFTYSGVGGLGVARATPAGEVTLFPDPLATRAYTITVGADGALWYDSGGTSITRVTTSGVFTRFSDTRIDIAYGGITTGPDGNIWFTAVGEIGRMTPTGALTFFDLHDNRADGGIAVGSDGNLWFGSGQNSIGRITPTGTINHFVDGSINNPGSFVKGPDGNVWFVNSATNSIGRITMAGSVSNFTQPSMDPAAIAAGPDGAMWFGNFRDNSISRIQATSTPSVPMNVAAAPGPASAKVSWSPPTSGGLPVTSYQVTATPGGATCTWTSGPLSCSFAGLSNGVAYTFTVAATNAHGPGLVSAPSPAVTPTAVGVNLVQPNAGLPAGGKPITIKGWGFAGATGVRFGPTPATSFTVVSDTTITAVSPARPLGLVNVFVQSPSGTSVGGPPSWFNYVTGPTSAPTITAMTPNAGPIAGGTSISMTGTGFLTTSAVRFGPGTAASFEVVSDTRLNITTPPYATGLVNVWVTNNIGTSASASVSWFHFRAPTGAPPTITSLSPNRGSQTANTTVTIRGTGFTGATLVRFGSVNAFMVTIVDDTTITAIVHPHSPALVSAYVTTQNGTNANTQASWFIYP